MNAPGGGTRRRRGRDFPPSCLVPGVGGADWDDCGACERGWVWVCCCGWVGVWSCGRPPRLLPPPSLCHDAGDRQAAHRGDTGGQPTGEARTAAGGEGWSGAGRPQALEPQWPQVPTPAQVGATAQGSRPSQAAPGADEAGSSAHGPCGPAPLGREPRAVWYVGGRWSSRRHLRSCDRRSRRRTRLPFIWRKVCFYRGDVRR